MSGPNGIQTPRAEKLASGAYKITVTDSLGCQSTETFVALSPEPLEISLLTKQDATCHQENGSAVVQAKGGTGDFSFLWNTTPPFDGVGQDNLGPG